MLSKMLPFSKRRNTRRVEAQSRLNPVRNLSRSLTIPIRCPQKIGIRRTIQQTLDQPQSPLFQLPTELRAIIWKLVLGGHCVAHDISGVRIGDGSDPWPPWETPGAHRRGLRAWAYQPKGGHRFFGLLLSCRRTYSEGIDILYHSNLFYFRNPFTNWSLSSWEVLQKRFQRIRVLVLDETIGDPSIVFKNPKQWKHNCFIIASMPKLKTMYVNIDTLYPKAWTHMLEIKLLEPIRCLAIPELHVIVRWRADDREIGPEESITVLGDLVPVIRVNDYSSAEDLYEDYPAADMRIWIIEKIKELGSIGD